jgi:spore coat protein U-like protein
MTRLRLYLLAALLALFATDARALCTAVCTCTVSTTNVVFATINPLSLSDTDSVGGVTVNCGGVAGLLIPVTVDISKGTGASFSARTMSSGANKLSYQLYTDAGRSTVFGDGTGGTGDVNSGILLNVLGIGPVVNVPVYGRVFGGQTTTPPGAYADSIAVTVTYY